MRLFKRWLKIFLLFSGVISQEGYCGLAANLSGNLIVTPPECILNNGQQQIVQFNDILLTRIDGVNYQQTLEFDLTCDALATNLIKLTLVGETVCFNRCGSLRTNNPKLGITFYVNENYQAINEPFNVDYMILPKIKVVPVKSLDADYKDTDGGRFTALATLKVDYQ